MQATIRPVLVLYSEEEEVVRAICYGEYGYNESTIEFTWPYLVEKFYWNKSATVVRAKLRFLSLLAHGERKRWTVLYFLLALGCNLNVVKALYDYNDYSYYSSVSLRIRRTQIKEFSEWLSCQNCSPSSRPWKTSPICALCRSDPHKPYPFCTGISLASRQRLYKIATAVWLQDEMILLGLERPTFSMCMNAFLERNCDLKETFYYLKDLIPTTGKA